jgi:hypothetical protein
MMMEGSDLEYVFLLTLLTLLALPLRLRCRLSLFCRLRVSAGVGISDPLYVVGMQMCGISFLAAIVLANPTADVPPTLMTQSLPVILDIASSTTR